MSAIAIKRPSGATRLWLLATLLVVATFVAYQSVWHAGFVWDDDDYVTKNTMLRTFHGLTQIWSESSPTTQYYPLTYSTFWLEYHLWGLHPLGYHLVNVSLHALNAILVWLVLRKLGVTGAWFAAAIFALHPVHVESVAWITELKNVLSGFFYLAALLAYLRFLTADAISPDFASGPGAESWKFYWLSFALFLCALGAKTVTCTFPLVILLLVWWKRGRLGWRDVRLMLPFLALSVAMGLTTRLGETIEKVGWDFSAVERFLIAGRSLWFYAGKLLWPQNLTFIYPRWLINQSAWWQYLYPLGVVAVILALWALRKRWGRGPLVAVLFFAGTLSIALGFFNIFYFLYSFVADHFQYLASIGLIALVASVGTTICERTSRPDRQLGAALALVTLVVLGTLTWRRGRDYRDAETLWRDTLAKNPGCWLAHNNLGIFLMEARKPYEAIGHWEQALLIRPHYAMPHSNLGLALFQLGKTSEAIAHYEQALRIDPDYAEVHNKLGNALLRVGRPKEAIAHYEQALRLVPDFVEVENNLAWLLATIGPAEGGNPARAVALAQRVCKQTDNSVAGFVDTLAVAYASAGRFNDAIAAAQRASALARADGQLALAQEIEARARLYRDGRAYRQDQTPPAKSSST